MALENGRRPYPCRIDFMGKKTANECALPAKGITWGDDEARVCGHRCIQAAIDSQSMTDREKDLAKQIAEREFGDAPTDTPVQVMLDRAGVEFDG